MLTLRSFTSGDARTRTIPEDDEPLASTNRSLSSMGTSNSMVSHGRESVPGIDEEG